MNCHSETLGGAGVWQGDNNPAIVQEDSENLQALLLFSCCVSIAHQKNRGGSKERRLEYCAQLRQEVEMMQR